jgi:hypothetical protein
MKLLTCLILLVTSQFSHAVTASEQDCVVKSVYHEARSLPKDWLKIANVAYNRSIRYQEYTFGAKSRHLCDIIKAGQYTSSIKLRSKLLEPERYEAIKIALILGNWKTVTKAIGFETKNHKMIYSYEWRK